MVEECGGRALEHADGFVCHERRCGIQSTLHRSTPPHSSFYVDHSGLFFSRKADIPSFASSPRACITMAAVVQRSASS